LDQPYRGKNESTTISPMFAVAIALGLGIFSALLVLTKTAEWYIPVMVGAIGIVVGTYSLRIARTVADDKKMMMLILAGVAVALSVIGFVMGISMYK
jgi:uncharacterized membrane protein